MQKIGADTLGISSQLRFFFNEQAGSLFYVEQASSLLVHCEGDVLSQRSKLPQLLRSDFLIIRIGCSLNEQAGSLFYMITSDRPS
jgi:hypothetical protein